MNERSHARFRALWLAPLLLLLPFAAAHAKVGSVRIARYATTGPTQDGAILVNRPTLYLTMLPVKLAAEPAHLPADSTVRITTYIADGADPLPGSWHAASVELQRFAYDTPGSRIDRGMRTIPLAAIRDSIPEGTYSFYVTVDDGDGPSPPSNVLKLRIYDEIWGFERPELVAAESPASGAVRLTLRPLVTRRAADTPIVIFSINWAAGERSGYDGYQELRNTLDAGSIPHEFYIQQITSPGIDMKNEHVTLDITGLPAGKLSFYVKVSDGTNQHYTEPSNIVVADVMGPGSDAAIYVIRIGSRKEAAVRGAPPPERLFLW